MAKDIQIAFREDPEIRRKAAAIVRSMGLDLSAALRMFLRQVVRTRTIPFRMESGFTLEGEKALMGAIREHEEDREAGRVKTFDSAKELFDDLERGRKG
ncbi:MAG TPA: type II toxin-antitoxin system RelB/DinJ family antitoxin [Bdellovibrionota bacterium]|nr:type II toxin-antitoxin system RelB/DinJ family antitoxin [Bdellovibrionota bacterium]